MLEEARSGDIASGNEWDEEDNGVFGVWCDVVWTLGDDKSLVEAVEESDRD